MTSGRRASATIIIPPDADVAWQQDAKCKELIDIGATYLDVQGEEREYEADLWFPESASELPPASVNVCNLKCPVRDQCLQWAITVNEQAGIWGGLNFDQRDRMRRAQQRANRGVTKTPVPMVGRVASKKTATAFCECGRAFNPYLTMDGQPKQRQPPKPRKYCSRQCLNKYALGGKQIAKCKRPECGNEFDARTTTDGKPNGSPRFYCSPECRSLHRRQDSKERV